MEMYDMKEPTDFVPAQFPTPFSEQAVPQEVASALRQAAERIRRFGEQQNKAILGIGRELAAAKEFLPSHHLLGPWIRKEFGMTDETAGAYLAAMLKMAADPASDNKLLRPKLIAWHPERERERSMRYRRDRAALRCSARLPGFRRHRANLGIRRWRTTGLCQLAGDLISQRIRR